MKPPQAVIRIEWPALPPKEFSRNGGNLHWSVRAEVQQQIADAIYLMLLDAGWDGRTWEKAHVKVTFLLPRRGRYDHDNLVTAMKPLLDSLGPQRHRNEVTRKVEVTQQRLLKDDDLKTIGIPEYGWDYRKGRPGTVIEVTERK